MLARQAFDGGEIGHSNDVEADPAQYVPTGGGFGVICAGMDDSSHR